MPAHVAFQVPAVLHPSLIFHPVAGLPGGLPVVSSIPPSCWMGGAAFALALPGVVEIPPIGAIFSSVRISKIISKFSKIFRNF